MKQTIAHFIIALCIAGMVRADQAVKSVQQALKNQGFYYGNVTGDKSAETISAIRRYQIRNGLQVTGEMNPETLQSLNVGSKATSASSSQPASNPAVAQSNNIHPDQSARAAENPLPQPPREAARQLDTSQPFAETFTWVPAGNKERTDIAEAQRQLLSRGYYRGRIDGKYRRQTALAVRAFQFQSGLPPTGHLDTSTLNALGLSTENLASMQPAARQYETWIPTTKFKHGKWKVKWKKYYRGNKEGYVNEKRDQNGDAWQQPDAQDD